MNSTIIEEPQEAQDARGLQHMQRRIIRLLFQHDAPLFRRQFRLFFVQSTLPQIPLLQQYDRNIRLRLLSSELLDDILPRIRRQLSLKTGHARLREEAPTRGDIDWPRTIERNLNASPGLSPLQFETRLRQRSLETPENLLVIAILLAYRQELREALREGFADEQLSAQERQEIVGLDEQAERELAAPYARALLPQARRVRIAELAQQLATRLRPGPYRDLLAWWQRFTRFRIGRADEQRSLTLASKRSDEKTAAWLYELWIALEFLHLLHEQGVIQPQDVHIASDLLQFTFTWQGRRFRFIYNRQLDTMTGYQSDWQHGPSSRPDYTIERETPLEICHEGALIWREPPVLLDAKYYLEGSDPANTHEPLKKLLGDMTLLGAQVAALLFPQIPEPAESGQQVTRIVRREGRQYHGREVAREVHLYRLEPTMPFESLHKRLCSLLNFAAYHLPERPAPVCAGAWLDPDNVNSSHSTLPAETILCPKPHVGPHVFDLVNVNTDCLKNPRLCHVIGQSLIPPFVVRVTTRE